MATESGRLMKTLLRRAEVKGTRNLDAYELALKGWEVYGRWTRDDFARAKALFHKSIALDPNYAHPYAGLALTLVWEVYSKWSPEEALGKAVQLARTAIEGDNAEAWGHWALGAAYLKQGRYAEAVIEYERALALNPNDSDILAESAWPLSYTGDPEAGIRNAQLAMGLNPHYPDWYRWAIGVAYYDARWYAEAIEALRARQQPNLKSNLYLAAAYGQNRQTVEAAAVVARILEEDPQSSVERWGDAQPYQDEALLKHYIEGLRKAGLPEKQAPNPE